MFSRKTLIICNVLNFFDEWLQKELKSLGSDMLPDTVIVKTSDFIVETTDPKVGHTL